MNDETPLPPDVRALVAVERVEVPLAAEQVDRIHAAVRRRIAAGGGGGSVPQSDAAARTMSGGLRGVERGALLVTGAVIGALLHASWSHRAPPPATTRVQATQAAHVVVRPEPVTSPVSPAPIAVVAPAPAVPVAEPSVQPDPSMEPSAPVHPRVAAAAPPAVVADNDVLRDRVLGAERVLVDSANSALARGQPADALEAALEHARRFPRGQLSEEREAVRIRALAALGRGPEAWARAEVFRSRFPHSMLLGAVERAVAADRPAP
jgi:hypothetical protein